MPSPSFRPARLLPLVLVALPSIRAQEVDYTMPPVVVTASGLEEPLSLSAASVSVVTAEDIENRQIYSLESALRGLPGITIASTGLGSGPAGLFIRGAKTEHAPIVWNGRPLAANMAGSFNLETLPLDNLDRVEVLRGPSSWLYGGGALGGVVNMISRDPRSLDKPTGGLYAEGGSFSSWRTGGTYEGSSGPFFYSLEGGHFRTEGYRDNGDFEETSGAVRLGFEIAPELLLDMEARYVASEAGVPGAATGIGANDPNNRLITESMSLSPRLVWTPTSESTHTLVWQMTRFRQAARHFDYPGGNNRMQVNENYLDYRWDQKLLDTLTLSAGARGQWRHYWRYNDDASKRDILENEDSVSGFAQADWEFLPNFSLIGGLRYEQTTDFGGELTGRAGLAWHDEELGWGAHAAYGTAFSPPTPQDRQPALYGNPMVDRPERGRGWEVGVEKTFREPKLRLSATWFRTRIDDLIEFDPTLFVLQRVDEATLEGVETGLTWNEGGVLEAGLNYTYLDARNDSDDRRLVRRPRHSVNASLFWRPSDRWLLGAEAVFIAGREDGFGTGQSDLEDYTVVRLTGRYRFTDNVEIFARIENALDENYEETKGYPAPGAAAFGGIRLSF